MNRLRWKEVSLSIPGPYQDLLVGQLAALGLSGFLQEENILKGFVQETQWNRELELNLRYCLQRFCAEFPHLEIRISTSSIRHTNWNKRWERSMAIIEPAPGIVIKPSWKRLRKKDKGKIVLHIDPKMSFGTGHHETTRLCLRLLQEYVQPKTSFLDFGSGTGILAIAAVKLGARRAVAVDQDEWTIPNIRENLKRNRVTNKVKAILGSVNAIPNIQFQIIAANVDLPTIVEALPQLVHRLDKGGLLILSGLLTSDLLALHDLLNRKGVVPLDIVEENEWAAVVSVRA